MNKVLFFVMISMAAMPAHAFKRVGDVPVPPPAAAQPAAPVAVPAKPTVTPQTAPSASVAAPKALPVPAKPVALPAPVAVKKAPPVKPVAEKSKPVVSIKHSANGATDVHGTLDVGQAIRNTFKRDAPAKSEAKPKTVEKAGKSASAKAAPEAKEESMGEKVKAGASAAGEKVSSWWERVKTENAAQQKACEANPESCSWGNNP